MNQKQLLSSVSNTYTKGLELIKIKNSDYADVENDAFKNFRSAEIVGVNYKRAILVRVLDKLSRISNLLDKTNQVSDETIGDTLVDACNYLAILKASIEDENLNKE